MVPTRGATTALAAALLGCSFLLFLPDLNELAGLRNMEDGERQLAVSHTSFFVPFPSYLSAGSATTTTTTTTKPTTERPSSPKNYRTTGPWSDRPEVKANRTCPLLPATWPPRMLVTPVAGGTADLFVIEDAPSMGHMMMSFVQLFGWLHSAAYNAQMEAKKLEKTREKMYGKEGASFTLEGWGKAAKTASKVVPPITLYVTYEHNYDHGGKDVLFDPLLRDIKTYALTELGALLVDLPRKPDEKEGFGQDARIDFADYPCPEGEAYNRMRVSGRTCADPERHLRDIEGPSLWVGHCAAWFDSPRIMRRWRSFIRSAGNMAEIWGDNEPNHENRVGDAADTVATLDDKGRDTSPLVVRDTERILVFDRPTGVRRALVDPPAVVRAVKDTCRTCEVTYYNYADYDGRSGGKDGVAERPWRWNAQLFGAYDIIVLVHGAASVNALYMPPGTGLIEIGAGDGSRSMFRPLAEQMGLYFKGVPYGGEGYNDPNKPVMPSLGHLKEGMKEVLGKRELLKANRNYADNARRLARGKLVAARQAAEVHREVSP